MQGKEAIIEKIISDAKLKEEALIAEAKAKAEKIIQDAESFCDSYKAKAQQDKVSAVEDIMNRSKTVAELDAKKMLFGAKNDVVAKTFDMALEKVKNLPKDKYSKIILGMLSYAEDGDVVTISKREKDIVTEAVIKDISAKKKIKLTLNKELGKFDGGIVLSGKGVDKNLTLDSEFQILKDELEEEVAKKLFAEA